MVTSAITGNKPQLDLNSVVTSAVTSGILSYANSTLGTNALKENMAVSDYVKNASINGIGQGISSEIRGGEFKDGFATGAIISVVSDGALQMRKYIKDNYNYVGDGKLSEGINGDGAKIGGSHPEKTYNENGKLEPKQVVAPTGGSQMKEGYLFGIQYENGGLIDKGIEYFAGPHDFMSSWNYENINGITYLKDNGALVNTASGLLLIPSVPFALAPFTQKYLDNIQDYRYIKKENEQTKQEAINKVKDNR